jgi:hypothetical protein
MGGYWADSRIWFDLDYLFRIVLVGASLTATHLNRIEVALLCVTSGPFLKSRYLDHHTSEVEGRKEEFKPEKSNREPRHLPKLSHPFFLPKSQKATKMSMQIFGEEVSDIPDCQQILIFYLLFRPRKRKPRMRVSPHSSAPWPSATWSNQRWVPKA